MTRQTRLLFCTTGILLRRLGGNLQLPEVSHVIVDEVTPLPPLIWAALTDHGLWSGRGVQDCVHLGKKMKIQKNFEANFSFDAPRHGVDAILTTLAPHMATEGQSGTFKAFGRALLQSSGLIVQKCCMLVLCACFDTLRRCTRMRHMEAAKFVPNNQP